MAHPETRNRSFFRFSNFGQKKNSAPFLVFLFTLTKQIYHSIFRFHWWVGLQHPIASDWLVCSINYICAVLFKRQCNINTNVLWQTDETTLWSQTILLLAAMTAFSLTIASLCSYRAVPHMILFYDLKWQLQCFFISNEQPFMSFWNVLLVHGL